jgi:sarcosine oxidase subunit beta
VGYLFLLPTEADVALFRRSVAVQNALGVGSRMVDLDEAAALNPWVDRDAYAGAAFSADDGWAHPPSVVAGYLRAARALGARVLTRTEVLGLDRGGDRITGVRTTAGTVATGTVVCCAGAWSQAVGAMAGVRLPVVPLRRQIALCGPPPRRGPRAPMPFTIDFGSTFYVHDTGPGPDAGLLLGMADPATAPGFGRDYDEAWLPGLREAARRCTPGLADLPVRSGWAGLYEMTPDHDGLLGEAAEVGRFLYAAGFSGHGFLQAPAVGEVVRDLVLGVAPALEVSPLHADRFAGGRPVRAEAAIV